MQNYLEKLKKIIQEDKNVSIEDLLMVLLEKIDEEVDKKIEEKLDLHEEVYHR